MEISDVNLIFIDDGKEITEYNVPNNIIATYTDPESALLSVSSILLFFH